MQEGGAYVCGRGRGAGQIQDVFTRPDKMLSCVLNGLPVDPCVMLRCAERGGLLHGGERKHQTETAGR